MNRLLLSCVLFLLPALLLRAQDYQHIISSGTAFYVNSGSRSDFLLGVKADSVIPGENGDTLFLVTDIFRPAASTGGMLDTMGSLPGRRIEKLHSGWFRFFNAYDDTLSLNTGAALNETWKFISLPQNGRLLVTCTAIQPEAILGVADTVKTFTFRATDEAGNDIPHFYNGKTIRLSRQFGLATMYHFYRMPDTSRLYSLQGRTDSPLGFRGLTWHDIYDYDIGDVFHTLKTTNYMITAGHYTRTTKTIKTVTSKQVAEGGASVTYGFDYCSAVTNFNPVQGYTTSYGTGTTSESHPYTYIPASTSGSPVPEIFNRQGVRYYSALQSAVPGLPATGQMNGYYDCCWHADLYYFTSANEVEYAPGLGMVHTKTPANIPYPGYFDKEDLKYYCKANQAWGSPLYPDCSHMVPVLSVSPAKLTIGYAAGSSGTLQITSNQSWVITDGQGGKKFAFQPSSGTGNAPVVVTAADSNVTGITVTHHATITGSVSTTDYPIDQQSKQGMYCYSHPDTLVIPWNRDSTARLHIGTTYPWNLACENWPAWVAVSPLSGYLGTTVDFTALEDNNSASSRSVTVSLINITGNRNILVKQAGRYGTGTGSHGNSLAGITPNPVRETALVTVPGTAGREKTVFLFDLTGRLVFSGRFFSENFRFSRGTLANGIYLMMVTRSGDSRNGVVKVILE